MVNKLSIGVIGIQGAISEHVLSMNNTFKKLKIQGEALVIKNAKQIEKIDALIIPGGESTTISSILYQSGLYETIINRIDENKLPIMGTCAGCVLLARELLDDLNEIKLLEAMDMKVKRNAFGRQRESFECNIKIKGFSKQYNAIFIRAPIIKKVSNNCKILSKIKDDIVMVRQDNFLALSFHPELSDDLRIQQYFLDMI